MTLAEILDAIKDEQRTANLNPEIFPAISRPGMECAVNQAKQKIQDLTDLYRLQFMETALGVFVVATDDQYSVLCDHAASHNAVCVSTKDLYRKVSKSAYELKVGTEKNLTIDHQLQLIQGLLDIARILYASFPKPQFNEFPVTTWPAFVDEIKRQCEIAFGTELNQHYLPILIAEKAFEQRACGRLQPVLPVFVQVTSVEEFNQLQAIFKYHTMANFAGKDKITRDDVEDLIFQNKPAVKPQKNRR